MFSNCTILLEDVLNTSQTPVDLEDARFKESLKSAAKELTCISMYLAFLDQGEMATEKWLADWQIVAMRQVEEMVAQPSCRVVLQKYAAKFADAMMREGAVEVCRMLHIAEHSDILLDALRAKRNYRNELIFMALTHSIDELRQHMVLFSQF